MNGSTPLFSEASSDTFSSESPWAKPPAMKRQCRNCFVYCGNCPDEQRRTTDLLIATALRAGAMKEAIEHVLRYGKLGKQSRRRLKEAINAD